MEESLSINTKKSDISKILCAECEKKPPVYFCPHCNSNREELNGYCEECEEDMHKRRAIRFHKEDLLDFKQYAKIWEDDHLIVTKRDHLKDQINLVCFLKGKKIKTGPKFQELSNNFKEDENIYSIGFIGPSGVGKSRLLRILFDHKDSKPLPASKKSKSIYSPNIHSNYLNNNLNFTHQFEETSFSSFSSTSSDIHGYFTEISLENESKKTPIILYDSEGIGGTTKPQSLLFDILPKQFNNYSEFKEYRKQIVNIVYPRLMYLFNDIICFPYCGSAREQGLLLERLILFAEIATCRSSNTGYFPSLIIIFNKQSPDDDNLWDPFIALNEWNKVIGSSELNRYYDSIHVIYIPDSRSKPHLFIHQIQRLRDIIINVISIKKEKKNFFQINLHKREYFYLFRTAIKMFSKEHYAKFNFFDLISFIQKRSSIDPVEQLENYFYYHFTLNGNNYYEAIYFILYRLCDLIILENYRSKIGTFSSEFLAINITEDGGAEVPSKYIEILAKFQGKITHLAPCSATNYFGDKLVHCECRKQYHHRSYHTSSETYQKQIFIEVKKAKKKDVLKEINYVTSPCRWEGDYQPPDDIVCLLEIFKRIFSNFWKENNLLIRKKNDFLLFRSQNLRNITQNMKNKNNNNVNNNDDVNNNNNKSDINNKNNDNNVNNVNKVKSDNDNNNNINNNINENNNEINENKIEIDQNKIEENNPNCIHLNNNLNIINNNLKIEYNHEWKKYVINICLSCIFNVPSEVISCGHSLCIDCIKENVIEKILYCPLCFYSQNYFETQIPRSAGVRILSLDGGGIRGIVELLILKEIEEKIHLPIVKAFDLICGTSTGGIIALFLTYANQSVDQSLQLFKDIPKKIFHRRLPLLPWFLLNYRYHNKELKRFVKSILGTEREMVKFSVPKVCVTSTTISNTGNLAPVLFTSYIRQSKDYLPQFVISKAYQAALATSAAGTYFPVYSIGNVDYTDGGMVYNCPSAPAIMEAKEIFGEHKRIDILLSVGNYEKTSDNLLKMQFENSPNNSWKNNVIYANCVNKFTNFYKKKEKKIEKKLKKIKK